MDEWFKKLEGKAWERVTRDTILIWCDECRFRFVTTDLDAGIYVRAMHYKHEHQNHLVLNAYDMAKHRSKKK